MSSVFLSLLTLLKFSFFFLIKWSTFCSNSFLINCGLVFEEHLWRTPCKNYEIMWAEGYRKYILQKYFLLIALLISPPTNFITWRIQHGAWLAPLLFVQSMLLGCYLQKMWVCIHKSAFKTIKLILRVLEFLFLLHESIILLFTRVVNDLMFSFT